jgi:hypothetical protein
MFVQTGTKDKALAGFFVNAQTGKYVLVKGKFFQYTSAEMLATKQIPIITGEASMPYIAALPPNIPERSFGLPERVAEMIARLETIAKILDGTQHEKHARDEIQRLQTTTDLGFELENAEKWEKGIIREAARDAHQKAKDYLFDVEYRAKRPGKGQIDPISLAARKAQGEALEAWALQLDAGKLVKYPDLDLIDRMVIERLYREKREHEKQFSVQPETINYKDWVIMISVDGSVKAGHKIEGNVLDWSPYATVQDAKAEIDLIEKKREELKLKKMSEKTAISKVLPSGPIRGGTPEAVEQLKAKLVKLEHDQELMKATNRVLKKKGIDTLKELVKLGYSQDTATKLLKPDMSGRLGYPHFRLQSQLQEMQRVKDRIAEEQARVSTYAGGSKEYTKAGVRVVENVEANRLQLFFDGKPPENIRDELKHNGYHWSPTEGAWQRQLTKAAVQSLSWMKFMKEPEPEPPAENVESEIKELEDDIKGIDQRIKEIESYGTVGDMTFEGNIRARQIGALMDKRDHALKKLEKLKAS